MSTTGHIISTVKDGVIAVPPDAGLADGTVVQLIPLSPLPTDPPFLKVALELAKPRDWPPDFALNHGHYTKGHPKK